MKYEVYRQEIVDGEIKDILVITTFTESQAKTMVQNLRKAQHNQLAYYKEAK